MEQRHSAYAEADAAGLVHLTGPCRGRVTWLNGPVLDITIDDAHFVHVADAKPGEPVVDAAAHLHREGEGYEIASPPDRSVWVNGVLVKARKLRDRDVIEFGENGPLSRFRLYREDLPPRKPAADILGDGLVYLRVSRQPVLKRLLRAAAGLVARLARETTWLFRIGVIIALVALATAIYQQSRLNDLQQQQLAEESRRLEDFSTELARARDDALTRGDLNALQQQVGTQLVSAEERLRALEQLSQSSARVIAAATPSVVFLQSAYGFRERATGRMLRHVIGTDGTPVISVLGRPMLTLNGDGPVAERQISGTAFAVGDGRTLVTNRHLALPWESAADSEATAEQDLEPVMLKFIAYAPASDIAGSVELVRISDEADLAILRLDDETAALPPLNLAAAVPSPGDEIIVMGYPTGLRAMLAQTGRDFIAELREADDTDFWSVAARLAEKGYITPLASRGIVARASPATIVYDAETTHGGSGGPVLDVDGAVVAVNTAILPEYGGSNLGVPVSRLTELLKAAGL